MSQVATRTTLVVDPRPDLGTAEVALAPRPGMLAGRRVVLFDNGKLVPELGSHAVVYEVLAAELERRFPGVTLARRSEDLIDQGAGAIERIAEEVAAARPDGVVLGLCDYGVSAPTAALAIELERRGIPTSLICQEGGYGLVASIAAQLIPGMPLSQLAGADVAAWWLAMADQVAAETARIVDDVVDGLVASPDALRQRATCYPAAPPLRPASSGFLEIPDADPGVTFTARMAECGLGDGLPLVAPTPDRVDAMLEAASVEPNAIAWPAILPRTTPLTAREVATIAVMAGCEPRWFRVVWAAYRAMAEPPFRLAQAAITTNPSGTMVLVSGPEATTLGLAAGAGCLGSGYKANATIGRAVALAYSFGLGARPGASDLCLQGSPARFSYCFAENLAESPWPGLHAEVADRHTTTVTVLKCEGPHSVGDNLSRTPRDLLTTIASATSNIGSGNAHHPHGETVVILNPAHARILAAAGWSKDDARRYLFEVARRERAEMEGRGGLPRRPRWMDSIDRVPVVRRPEDFLIVVAGAGGLHSLVAPPWGPARAVTVPLPPPPASPDTASAG